MSPWLLVELSYCGFLGRLEMRALEDLFRGFICIAEEWGVGKSELLLDAHALDSLFPVLEYIISITVSHLMRVTTCCSVLL